MDDGGGGGGGDMTTTAASEALAGLLDRPGAAGDANDNVIGMGMGASRSDNEFTA